MLKAIDQSAGPTTAAPLLVRPFRTSKSGLKSTLRVCVIIARKTFFESDLLGRPVASKDKSALMIPGFFSSKDLHIVSDKSTIVKCVPN